MSQCIIQGNPSILPSEKELWGTDGPKTVTHTNRCITNSAETVTQDTQKGPLGVWASLQTVGAIQMGLEGGPTAKLAHAV